MFLVCGTTGKRMACKDCSCGLAEELSSEATQKLQTSGSAKSSCGSVCDSIFIEYSLWVSWSIYDIISMMF